MLISFSLTMYLDWLQLLVCSVHLTPLCAFYKRLQILSVLHKNGSPFVCVSDSGEKLESNVG